MNEKKPLEILGLRCTLLAGGVRQGRPNGTIEVQVDGFWRFSYFLDYADVRAADYFVAIGFDFMFVEISQMQRLTIFLGQPIFGLAVLTVLLGLLVVTGVFTSRLIADGAGLPTPLRIVVAVALVWPTGFFMGMPFPLGMAAAAQSLPDLTPWLWGANGAGSVCASVLAVAVAMEAGISTAFWIGLACYAVAFLVSFFLRSQGRAASLGGKT